VDRCSCWNQFMSAPPHTGKQSVAPRQVCRNEGAVAPCQCTLVLLLWLSLLQV
jgi:hypothetical protein